MYFTRPSNFNIQNRLNLLIFLSGIATTSYGIHFCWTEKFNNMVYSYPSEGFDRFGNPIPGLYEGMKRLINWLIWLRLWVIIFMAVIIVCLVAYVIKNKITGQPDFGFDEAEENRNNRVGIESVARNVAPAAVYEYLKKRSRNYDSKKDGKTEECVICLEEFKDDDKNKVVELECGHLFH